MLGMDSPFPRRASRHALPTLLLAMCALLSIPGQTQSAGTTPSQPPQSPLGWMPPDVFGTGEGLPDPTVNSIASLPNGQVWMGTMQGLARQDGARLTHINGLPGMNGRAVHSVATSTDGDVYAAYESTGIFRLQHGVWASLGSPFGAQRSRRIRIIEVNGEQRIYATGDGVARWVGQHWQHLPLPVDMQGYEIFDIAVQAASDNQPETIWLGSFGAGLLRCITGQACTRVKITGAGPRTNEVRSLLLQPREDGQQALWVAMLGGGVARFQAGVWTRWSTANSSLPSDFVNDLAQVKPDPSHTEIWAGTRGGLAMMSNEQVWRTDRTASAQTQQTSRIRSISTHTTSQGQPTVWVGTDGGAMRIPLAGPWQVISTLGNDANGIWGLWVESVEDGQQRVWLATDGDGVARLEHGQWQHYGKAEGIPNQTVRSVLRVPNGSKQGSLWIGTWAGHVLRLQGDHFIEVATPWRKQDDESASLMLADNSDLWASSRTQGIAHWNGRGWDWMPAGHEAPNRIYAAVKLGQDVWFSTLERGLARLRAGQWRYFQSNIGLPQDTLYDLRVITVDGHPQLWTGSNKHGLLRIDVSEPDQPRLITQPTLPTLPIPLVYGALQDGAGDVLVCTDYGVFLWRATATGYTSTAYHRQDGLPHDECNGSAMQKDANGRVWIGTVGGAAVYTPWHNAARKPSQLIISDLMVDGNPIAMRGGVIQLPKRDSSLELKYSLLTGEKEAASRYRVQLSDVPAKRDPWGNADSHVLARLPSGRQHVRIEAMDFAGTLAAPIELTVDVPYLWWQTPVARTLMAMCLLLLFWAVLRLRLQHLRKQEDLLREMVKQRTAQLQASDGALRKANDDLHRLSYTDALTGLANRRRLFEALTSQFRNAQAQQRPLGVLMIDLDHFKQLNDSLGHLTGDRCLKEIAQCLLAQLPPQGLAARYGGEEFCVLLPGLDATASTAMAELLRRCVETMPTPCCDSHRPRLTISVGVAALAAGQSGPIHDADALLAAADRALYAAKDAGRNRVKTAQD